MEEKLCNLNTYAVCSKDTDLRMKSSSGAVFSMIAENVIKSAGVVYGVRMSEDCYSAEYCRVDNIEELGALRGSKYLQPFIGDTFIQVKKDLEKGIPVLFTGVSCCINGLKGYLTHDYSNLICIDVICHGVPSQKLWKKYVLYTEEEKRTKLLTVNFRCKDINWKHFGMKESLGTEKIFISKDDDPYMQMFLRDYSLRPSCYGCIAKKQKLSDITIADFWGIENVVPEMDDEKGVSLVIVRTKLGQQLFDNISNFAEIKLVTYENGIRCNPAEFRSVGMPRKRKSFYKDMNNLTFSKLLKKYTGPLKVSYRQKVKNIIMKNFLRKDSHTSGGGSKFSYGMLYEYEYKYTGKLIN